MRGQLRYWGWMGIIAVLAAASLAQGTKPASAPDPAQQLQSAIATVQARLSAMDAKYGRSGIAGTLNAAYKAKGTTSPQDATAWNDWMSAAWSDDKPFYEAKLAALKAELDTLRKTGKDPQIGSLKSGMAAWQQNESKISGLFQQMTDKVAQQALLLNQAAKNPAQRDALTKQAAQLKVDAEHLRASANAVANPQSAVAGKGKPATGGGGKGTSGGKGGGSASNGGKGGKGTSGKGDKGAKSAKGGKGSKGGGEKGKKSSDNGNKDNSGGKDSGPTPVEQSVTVCKCKPSEYPFNKQTIDESIQSSDPDIAEAKISDGRLVITGKKYGKTTITVKGDVVKYNTGIPDAPKPGTGGIHGGSPNEVPLNGNYGFAYKITVHVICDLNGSWSGAPVGSVKLVDSCGSVQMATQKSVFSGNAVLGSKGYGKIKLTHALTLDEVSKSLPDEVRQQVAGHTVTIEGSVGEGENSISGTLTKDKVHWVQQDDGSYSVDFPGKITENVLITRDGADGGGKAKGK